MRFAAICMSEAKTKQIIIAVTLHFSLFKAKAEAVITGIRAPVSVLGRQAKIHARGLFCLISMCKTRICLCKISDNCF